MSQQLQEAIGEASADEAAALARALRDPGPAPGPRRRGRAVRRPGPRRRGAASARCRPQIDELTAARSTSRTRPQPRAVSCDEAKRRASAAAAAMYRSDDLASMYADMLDVDDVNQVASRVEVPAAHLRPAADRRSTALAGLKQQIETLQQEADAQREAGLGRASAGAPGAGRDSRAARRAAAEAATRPRRKRPTSRRSSRRSGRRRTSSTPQLSSLQAASNAASAAARGDDSGARRAARRSTCGARCPARSPTGSVRASTRSSGPCGFTPASTCTPRKASRSMPPRPASSRSRA